MERRIGAALILVEDHAAIVTLNKILSNHSQIIMGRQGIPLKDRSISVISLVLEGTTDEMGALTGQIGRIRGLQVKSVLTKYSDHD